MTPVLNDVFWRLLGLVPFMAAGFAIEEMTQRRRTMPASLRFNLTHLVLFWLVYFAFGATLVAMVVSLTARLPGAGLIGSTPTTWIGVVVMALAWLVLRDFFYYWQHRLQHRSPWLWAQHEVHHADEAMNVTTTFRHHWLEMPLQSVCVTAPVAYLVAIPVEVAVVMSVAGEAIGHFIHLDAPVSLGRWIASPAQHRIHHSTALEHRDKNFAALLPLWDVWFGTYYAPEADTAPTTGLASGEHVRSLTQALAWPFVRWWGMLRG